MIRFFSERLRNGNIAEVGVLFGDFSRFLIDEINPHLFDAYDIFTSHEYYMIWGKRSAEQFNYKNHLDFYRDKFANEIEGGVMRTHVGDGASNLRKSDVMYDMIYIDANHSYEAVANDADAAISRLKNDGLLIFNDYTLYDLIEGVPYGIVQVVNDLCVNKGWKVKGFALQVCMFNDIAIGRG